MMIWLCIVGGVILMFAISVVLRKRANPKTSYIMAILNISLNPVRALKLPPFHRGSKVDIIAVMADSAKVTGLSDFGDMTFVDDYKAITEYPLYKSLVFSNLGLIAALMEFNIVVSRRLQMVQYLKQVPYVLSIPVTAPVFVFGLGRSGTTFVHRLLALDPACRAPLLWELMLPVPRVHASSATQDDFDADRKDRAEEMQKRLASREVLGDHTMEHLHEVGYDLPEECLFALSDEMPFSFHYIYTILRSFKHFKASTRPDRVMQAYCSYRRTLQLLSFQTGEALTRRRWVLKCPLHVNFLHELVQVFPDAKFVWAHRNPAKTISSACSLVEGIHNMYYERHCLDRNALGEDIVECARYALEKAPNDIDRLGLDCADVLFDDLVADPAGTVRAVYKHFGWDFSRQYEQILKDFLVEDKLRREDVLKRKGSRKGILHEHSLEYFGLTEEDLKFEAYIKRYGMENCRK